MRVKWSHRWSRAAARRSVMGTGRAYAACSYAATPVDAASVVVPAVVGHETRPAADDHPAGRGVERLPLVALRELIDVLPGAFFVELSGSLHLEVPVRVVVVPDADRDAGVTAQISSLGARGRCVEDEVLAV